MVSDIAERVTSDVANGYWYMHGQTPLGGCDFWQPKEVLPDGAVEGRTGNFHDKLVLSSNEYQKMWGDPLVKVDMWSFEPPSEDAELVRCVCRNPQGYGHELASLRRQLSTAKAAIERLIKLAREIGPTPPGHSCGPGSMCDAGCHAYAEFDQILRDAVQGRTQ
jgi:hypothetical protein